MRKKNGAGGTNLPDFRLYTTKLYSSRQYDTGTKTEIQTNGVRQEAQTEINPRTYGYLIFDKGGKNMQWVVLGKLDSYV